MNPPTGSITTLAHDTTSDASSPLLQASGLSCRRAQEWLFRDLSFALSPGQMLWLRGHNGSGKTTLLRVLAGLSHADEGRLSWGGETGPGPAGRLVYVGHLNAMKDDLTVCESLRFVAALQGGPSSRESAVGALRLLGMHHRRNAMVRTLSQGQRRRAALARLALELHPSVWLLDEPFDALDSSGVAVVNQLLKGHLERGGAVLLTSHLALDATAPPATELTLDQGVAA